MFRSLFLLPLIAAAPVQTAPPVPARIFIASDSTAQDYKPNRYPQSGWGTMLRCAVDGGVTVENRAIGGRSTRSFVAEGRLDGIARDIRAGDTLLIQFGHNDASADKPERFTSIPDYEINLRRMIDVARKAGAQPVILTPVTRRSFDGMRVEPSFPTYAEAARAVAEQTRTPLIELGTLSGKLVERAGPDASKRYFLHYTAADKTPGFPDGVSDDTHFSEMGARAVADIVADRLRALRLPVSKHIASRRPALTRTTPLGGPSCG